MKNVMYFFLFLICLLATTWSLFAISGNYLDSGSSFVWQFVITFVSMGGAILFGYAFMNAKK